MSAAAAGSPESAAPREDVQKALQLCLANYASVADVIACSGTCRRWRHFALKDEWLKECVLSGNVLESERRRLWWHAGDVERLQQRWCKRLSREEAQEAQEAGEETVASRQLSAQEAFKALSRRTLPSGRASEIERDVSRTFPTHPRFRAGGEGAEGRAQLSSVLRALAAAEPDVGYCQGMNFVAAMLLLALGQAHHAFWMLLAMVDGYHFRHVFSPGVPMLPLRVFQFSGVVREHLPRLWRHLQSESFSLDIFAQQCVLTLFAYSIHHQFLVYIYDVFFVLGWEGFFRVGLGLLANLEPQLLGMSVEDISRFLHQAKREFQRRELRALLRFQVEGKTLESLQRDFQLRRFETLLHQAPSGVGAVDASVGACGSAAGGHPEPLPPGLERSKSGDRVLLHPGALRAQNAPPWLAAGAAEDRAPQGDTPDAPLSVEVRYLQEHRVALSAFDEQTSSDVASLRRRIAEVDRDLAEAAGAAAALRDEVARATLERDERRAYKEALMAALHTAVQSADGGEGIDAGIKTVKAVNADVDAAAKAPVMMAPGTAEMVAPPPPSASRPPRKDPLVAECLAKLERVEGDIFEKDNAWKATMDEWEPVREQLEELHEMKRRSMAQLLDFLDNRTQGRDQRLASGIDAILREDAS